MAAKRMFPPRQLENPFGDDYDEVKLRIGFRIVAGEIVMRFSDHVEWIRMTSAGARKLAALLIEQAAELDRRGNTKTSGAGNGATAVSRIGEKSAKPRKRAARNGGAGPAG